MRISPHLKNIAANSKSITTKSVAIKVVAITVALSITVVLSSCSLLSISSGSQTKSSVDEEPTLPLLLNSDLYLSRNSLQGTDFEHFKIISDQEIFVECGVVRRGREFILAQKVVELDKNSRSVLSEKLAELVRDERINSHEYEKPGDSPSSIADPGKFFFTIHTDRSPIHIRSSLDAISEPSNTVERRLLTFTESLRSSIRENITELEGGLCGNRSLYGISG